ncbi:MAG: tRNA-dihydrouridine synthase family protein [Desulfobacterales bacterium]
METADELPGLLARELKIGGRTIAGRLVFASMSLLGHVAFRELLDAFGGCALYFSEMCSAATIPTENPRVSKHFRWRREELPRLACQIMGSDAETMARAALRIEAEGFFGVDLNFSCSAATICRRGCGADLLRRPAEARRIVERVRRAVRVPLTIKFRVGWSDDGDRAVEMARAFADAGADALTFHPRVAPDRRARPPRWEYIRRVKQAVRIPVFGNGGVVEASDCLRMLRETGCDGVALGRIAVARPWVFALWSGRRLEAGGDLHRETALRLHGLLQRHFPPKDALIRLRRFVFYFASNFRFGHELYRKVQAAADMGAARAALESFFAAAQERCPLPNLNYFQ